MKNFLAVNTANKYGFTSGGSLIAGVWAVNTLVTGAIACFDSGGTTDGTIVDDTTPAPVSNQVKFAVYRNATDGTIFSPAVDRESLIWEEQAPVAAVAKTMFIGGYDASTGKMNWTTATAVGVWTVNLIDLSKEHWDTSRIITISDDYAIGTTEENVVDAIVAAINAHLTAKLLVTATKVGDGTPGYGVKLIGVTAGKNFTAYALDGIALADIYEYGYKNHAYTGSAYSPCAKAVAAIGDYTNMRDLEMEGEARKGINQEEYSGKYLGTPTSMLTAGSTYHTFVLTWRNTLPDQNMDRESKQLQQLVIGILSTNADCITSIRAILNSL
jgi:hypothetical protein